MFGQPGLFTPRTWLEWFAPCNLVSYYDTSVLKGTLERLVDFNRINNAGDVRLSGLRRKFNQRLPTLPCL